MMAIIMCLNVEINDDLFESSNLVIMDYSMTFFDVFWCES